MKSYVVAAFTFGSFRDFVTDPIELEEAREWIAHPPLWHGPSRPQDSLRIYELIEVSDA